MTDLSHVSVAEMLYDRQECFNDLAALAIAKLQGITEYANCSVDDRIARNLSILNTISAECKRRGFDPAIFPGKYVPQKDADGFLDDSICGEGRNEPPGE